MSKNLEGFSDSGKHAIPARDPAGAIPHHKPPDAAIEARAKEIEKEHHARVHAEHKNWDKRSSYPGPEKEVEPINPAAAADRHGDTEQK